ncbi:MAG: hypothetical protein A3A33_01655 [Candidatus Yanofskybacteria bacterium RIFCSPLOWO2_01_FULL_49_25]|uniref:Glycosyltransferase 2-like domain-containing protein n=1 Tax=Candidatus Yanofskybacteria bacterium RIFCSPLOWO2_01_FULL_49_25 TaxID=1802701 RepID=A0A1F8GYF2_9BACT|nr:MAG: hypothetical protein A3A33_01655 [Candidatus Yanofskybacteria bacterium RIFCSPLOWO2_01_FULL_49_25]
MHSIVKRIVRGVKRRFTPETPTIPDTPEQRKLKMAKIVSAVKAPVPSERELKMVEIIVLKYKDPEVETKCAVDVINHTDWPYKLVFYDNRPGAKNFSKVWNKLIKESTCDYVLVMDSDAFVPKLDPCWLTRMMQTFETHPDCWVVIPKVNRTSCEQQRAVVAEEKPPTILTEPFAAQCVLYKKTVFEKVGFYDEDFLFYGQDSEWSLRAMRKGFNTYIRHDVLIDHGKHSSIGKAAKKGEFDRTLESEYAQKLFEEKTRA